MNYIDVLRYPANMSAMPDAESGNVTTMRDFLEGTLDEAKRIDTLLHHAIHSLQERIYALRLAEDHDFVLEHQAFSERVEAGDAEPGLTADEFAERYLVK
jgi:hypothetical protein